MKNGFLYHVRKISSRTGFLENGNQRNDEAANRAAKDQGQGRSDAFDTLRLAPGVERTDDHNRQQHCSFIDGAVDGHGFGIAGP